MKLATSPWKLQYSVEEIEVYYLKFSTPEMEITRPSEVLITMYEKMRRQIPEDDSRHIDITLNKCWAPLLMRACVQVSEMLLIFFSKKSAEGARKKFNTKTRRKKLLKPEYNSVPEHSFCFRIQRYESDKIMNHSLIHLMSHGSDTAFILRIQ